MTFKTKKKFLKILGGLFFLTFAFFLGNFFQKQGDAWVLPTLPPPQGNVSLTEMRPWLCWDQSATPPQNVTVQALTLTTARVSWTAALGMDSYKISSSQTTGGPYIEVDTVLHPTDYLDIPDLSSLGEYYFVVQASTDGISWSDYSSEAYIQMPTNPDPPTGLTVSIYSHTALDLSWTAPVNNGGSPITGYKIERQTSGGAFSTIVADTGNTNTTYQNTGLVENTEYGYRVSTLTAGISSPSTAATKYTGHCYTTNGDCAAGYTSILGGAQSGCATQGPVNSPYPGMGDHRYRILDQAQTLTESGCVSTDAQYRYRIAQLSVNSGGDYSNQGDARVCRQCVRGNACRWRARLACSGNYWGCVSFGNGYGPWNQIDFWGACISSYAEHATCSTTCTLDCGEAICTTNTNCTASRWDRSCSDQSHTIDWCCRN